MWTDYKHFIIPINPSFVPEKEVITAIDKVLDKWGLKKGIPTVYNLTEGKNSILAGSLDNLHFEGGIALEYPGLEGEKAGGIIGESYYSNEYADLERHIESFTLIAGWDYRIHPGSEQLKMTVVRPPLEKNMPLIPYCRRDEILHVGKGQNICLARFSSDFLGVDVFQYYGQHAEAYSSTQNTLPPDVAILAADKQRSIGQQNFLGYWRTAFIIDFGNDLPKTGEDIYKIKNRALIKDIEMAFGTETIEIGHYY